MLSTRTALLLSWLSAVQGCNLEDVPAAGATTEADRVRSFVTMNTVELVRFERGQARFRANIDALVVDRERRAMSADGVQVDAFKQDEQRTLSMTLNAPRAQSDLSGSKVTFSGGVTIRDAERRTIRSDQLIYDGPEQTLTAPTEVILEGSNFRAAGPSMHGSIQSERIDVSGPALLTTGTE